MRQASDIPKPLINIDKLLAEAGMFSGLLRLLKPVLAKHLCIDAFNDYYSILQAQLTDKDNDPQFFFKALKLTGAHFELDAESYARIPKTGPLIVVANHPFGAIDGVILGALLAGIRPDSKLMGNYLLSTMEGIRGNIINVDPFERSDSSRNNLDGVRKALTHLRQGGCLGVFPAGEVSHYQHKYRAVADAAWTPHIVRLAQKTNSTVLPVYFEGHNSLLFQLVGLLSPRLRTALLAREYCRQWGTELCVHVGKPIEPSKLERFSSPEAVNDYLRMKTYSLRPTGEPSNKSRKVRLPFRASSGSKSQLPLAPPQLKHTMEAEVRNLPAASMVLEHGDFQVYSAHAQEIPSLLKEIGRLREATFREAQEGTGKAYDLDDFDNYYLHLFVWDAANSEVVGAYRMGIVDEIVKRFGKEGLYSNTLFKLRSGFIEKLGPAIELGRSFISLKYQKKHASLILLIKGVTVFCAQRPKYKIVFGPVSITDAYRNLSKNLMVHFFQGHSFDNELSRWVRAKKPPKTKDAFLGVSLKSIAESIRTIDAVSAIISGIEDDEKGLPVLLKHYLKLNGSMLSFNIDPAFSDVIDGLIVVDLTKSEPRVMSRYMGKELYNEFIEYNKSLAGKTTQKRPDINSNLIE
ncbi:MAG: GNAT family N-acetyltransferase [Verrucomicrobia bacterium]|nr:GNAT family N-acetyltransferase [Verrucomicrobiota bacterium]